MGTQLAYVRDFKDLELSKRQRELSREAFRLSKSFPAEERYSLTDQLRRASRSIGVQIAEAWAKRLYPKHFVSKLSDPGGEQMETQHWLIEAGDSKRLLALCEEIDRMLGATIGKAETFSSPDYVLRDEPPPYLAGG